MKRNVPLLRLHNQHLSRHDLKSPADVVKCFGAVQAQDYSAAKWALGLRVPGTTNADIEQAILNGKIIRTWPMRGTLHFVAAEDVRWMLALLTPRVVAKNAGRYRELELDEKTFVRSQQTLAKAMEGGKQLLRTEAMEVLEREGISTKGQRGIHILGYAAQRGLICYGPPKGKQFTFVLLDQWAPEGKTVVREEALSKLTARYFESHGPATLQDFAWWSGLTMSDARAGLDLVRPRLLQEVFDDRIFWMAETTILTTRKVPGTAYLLPPFDEYTVAYRDRRDILTLPDSGKIKNELLGPVVVIDGKVIGSWKRELRKDKAILSVRLFTTIHEPEKRAIQAAAQRYIRFIGYKSLALQM